MINFDTIRELRENRSWTQEDGRKAWYDQKWLCQN